MLMTSHVSHVNEDLRITKEHIATHTNLIFLTLYFSTLVIKCFKSSIQIGTATVHVHKAPL